MHFIVRLSIITILGIYLHTESTEGKPFFVICNELYVTGVWNKATLLTADFGQYNFTTDQFAISLIDKSCNNFTSNETHVWVTAYFDTCGSVINEEGDVLVQMNTADVSMFFRDRIVTRNLHYRYNMQCRLDRTKNTSTAIGYDIAEKPTSIVNRTDVYSFQANIVIYSSSSFLQEAPTPITVTSFQPIHIGISKVHQNSSLKFIVHQCFATPSANIDDTSKYYFFNNKCAVDNSNFLVKTSTNNVFNFVVNAFQFIALKKKVFIHCSLFVCKAESNTDNCKQTCRTRRDAGHHQSNLLVESRKRRETQLDASVPLEELTLSTKEISFEEKLATCEDITCQANAKCHNLYPAVCRCSDGYVQKPATGICEKERQFTVFGLHIDMKFVDTYNDPTTFDFLLLVGEIERVLVAMIGRLDRYQNVEGVKIVKIRPGSIVLDIVLIHANTSTKEKAFERFVEAVATSDETLPSDTATTPSPVSVTSSPTNNQTGSKKAPKVRFSIPKRFSFKIKKEKIPTLVDTYVLPPEYRTTTTTIKPTSFKPVSGRNNLIALVVVPFLAVAIVIYLIWRIKKNKRNTDITEDADSIPDDCVGGMRASYVNKELEDAPYFHHQPIEN